MLMSRFVAALLVVGTAASGPVYGQDYPSKVVRIVTSAVGGSPDVVARPIAQGLAAPLGQPVIVDNRPSGVIPGQIVSQAPPDGYTLLVYASTLWIGSLLADTPYDPVRDFAPVTLATRSPNILVVHPSLPVRSVKELIALAKARPGELNCTVGGAGGPSHLSGELLKAMARVNVAIVPYKSGAQETADLIGGHVQMTFGSAGQFSPHIKSGRLRALAVTTAQPSALFPGLPTMAASGLPGFEAGLVIGMFAPAKTPVAIINRLNQETVRLLNQPDVKQKFLASGIETVGNSPEEFAASVKSDMARWGKLIKEAGIRAE